MSRKGFRNNNQRRGRGGGGGGGNNGGSGGGGGSELWEQNYYPKTFLENGYNMHDDRNKKKFNNRRVSFKPTIGGNGGNNRNFNAKNRTIEMAIKTRIEEDDDMHENIGNTNNFRVKDAVNRFRRQGSPIPKGVHGVGNRKLFCGSSSWFLITIPFMRDFTIFNSLANAINPLHFKPYYQTLDGNAIKFYVDELKVAEALLNLDRQVLLPDGFKLLIKVRNQTPQIIVNDELKDKMKMAMLTRYTAHAKALDLTKFHADPVMDSVFCALFRPTVMTAALEVIADNIPDLEALNLSDNKIFLMDHMRGLSKKLPNLKILNIGNNRISTLSAMDTIKDCPLVELTLEGNPLKDRLTKETVYVSEIRKRFTKLQKLDGAILPPTIGFDVGDDSNLPISTASYLCDSTGADIVRQFLEQYFVIYDSDNRQPLLDAYHTDAMFSLTCTYSHLESLKLTPYADYNRNLARLRDLDGRMKLLKVGRLPVVSLLSELPQTQHDPQSFAVDLTLFTPQLISLTVSGVFKEKVKTSKNRANELKSFQKTMVIIPFNNGFCIKNECLHITNVTPTQNRRAFKPAVTATVTSANANRIDHVTNQMVQQLQLEQQNPSTSNLSARLMQHQPQTQQVQQQQQQHHHHHHHHTAMANLQPQSPVQQINSPTQAQVPDDNVKLQMVHAMAQNSKMNLEWSQKCLEQTNWDFDRAAFVFTELQKLNKIPPEAFI